MGNVNADNILLSALFGVAGLLLLELYFMFATDNRKLVREAKETKRELKKIELSTIGYLMYLAGEWVTAIIFLILVVFSLRVFTDIIDTIAGS